MTTWALVPIKPGEFCKTRLASVLTPREREAVAHSLLLHVLTTQRTTFYSHVSSTSAKPTALNKSQELHSS